MERERDINLIKTEASVGKFNVDILAEEENTGRKCDYENSCDKVGDLLTMYNFPIKKIVLFSGIIFSSAFLLLNALRHND